MESHHRWKVDRNSGDSQHRGSQFFLCDICRWQPTDGGTVARSRRFLGVFVSTPHLGKISMLTSLFRRGWNHQLLLIWIHFVWETANMETTKETSKTNVDILEQNCRGWQNQWSIFQRVNMQGGKPLIGGIGCGSPESIWNSESWCVWS